MLKRAEIQMTTAARFSTRPGLAIRRFAPNAARVCFICYVAQAAAGFAVGFAIPILRTMGVF